MINTHPQDIGLCSFLFSFSPQISSFVHNPFLAHTVVHKISWLSYITKRESGNNPPFFSLFSLRIAADEQVGRYIIVGQTILEYLSHLKQLRINLNLHAHPFEERDLKAY